MDIRDVIKELASYRNYVHAVAGATGGFTAMTVFYPLDTIRTILQVDDCSKPKTIIGVFHELINQHGISGLYKGWFPVVTSLWCSNFVYFYCYNTLKLYLYGKEKATPGKDLIAASIAGIINVLLTTPLWVVNTRLKLQGTSRARQSTERYHGMIDCFKRIARAEGIGALWNGTLPSLVLVCNPTIQFVVYEALKRRCISICKTTELSNLTLFLIGASAKATSTILTYPLQVFQSRLRAFDKTRGSEKPSVIGTYQHIMRTLGIKGFYQGLEAKLLQTILMAALMFLTYEKISRIIFKLMATN